MSVDEKIGRTMVVIVLLISALAVALGATWGFFVGWALGFALISLWRAYQAEKARDRDHLPFR